MLATKLLLAGVAFVLLLDLGHGASLRDTLGRQINFPDSEGGVLPDVEGGGQSKGFITRIFDMIKNLLGFGDGGRTTIVRNDGTIEEVDAPSGGGGFLSRISKRILGFINNILSVITGDGGAPARSDYSNVPAKASNEVERELIKMATNPKS